MYVSEIEYGKLHVFGYVTHPQEQHGYLPFHIKLFLVTTEPKIVL